MKAFQHEVTYIYHIFFSFYPSIEEGKRRADRQLSTSKLDTAVVSNLTAPPSFSKRRVRVTWEAEGWGEGEENATELESAEPAQFGSNAYDDSDGYYGSVADTRSAESQQVIGRLIKHSGRRALLNDYYVRAAFCLPSLRLVLNSKAVSTLGHLFCYSRYFRRFMALTSDTDLLFSTKSFSNVVARRHNP